MRHLRLPLLLLALFAFGCAGEPVPEEAADDAPAAGGPASDAPAAARPGGAPPPIVLVSIDTLRSDRLPAYGYDGVETPVLDAFRAEAVLFERAYAHAPLTLPSHASALSGRLPYDHGVRDNAGYVLETEDAPWVPRLLQDAGYATGAAVSSVSLDRKGGLAVGFDRYDDRMDELGTVDLWGAERSGASTLRAAVAWLDEVAPAGAAPSSPVFLFFHLFEPHLPYTPSPAARQRWGETYEAEIATADAVLGDFFAELRSRGLWEDAAVIVFSDHGEGLMDHGEHGHGILLYREVLQVPLMIKLPGGRGAGTAVSAPVGLVDLASTALELAGVAAPAGVDGVSLLRHLDGGAPPPDERMLYAETWYPRINYGWSELLSMIQGRWHYIDAPSPELYDLEADPAQENDVLRQNRRVYAELRDAVSAVRTPFEPPADVDEETRAKLASLGYASGGGAAETGDGPLPDPKELLRTMWEEMERGYRLVRQGEHAEAVPLFRSLLAKRPEVTDAWVHLATALRHLGRREEALEAYRQALESSRGAAGIAAAAGRLLLEMGRLDEAWAHAELAVEEEPGMAGVLMAEIDLARGRTSAALGRLRALDRDGELSVAGERLLGLTLARAGQLDAAVEVLEPLARAHPGPGVENALAMAYLEMGRRARAQAVVDGILLRGENAQALETAGLLDLEAGRLDAAAAHLERAVALEPAQANAWNLLGVVRYQRGDAAGALDAWERAAEDPRQLDALFNLGLIAAQRGETARARRALERYVTAAPPGTPDLAQARQLLARLEAPP